MKCPVCDGRLDIIESRPVNGIVRRKRECGGCLTEFVTTEKINYDLLPRYILDKLHEKAERR